MNNDLISREALLNSFNVRKVTEYDETGCGMDYKAVPVEAIEAAPAMDAEPMRHGRWIRVAAYNDGVLNTAKCSLCNTYQAISNWDFYDYCPFCGAMMDGE